MDAKSFAFLNGDDAAQTRTPLAKSREIAKGLPSGDFTALHAAESKEAPLFWMEGWWQTFLTDHGALRQAFVLGALTRGTATSAVVRLEFERGMELLTLQWSGDVLTGANSGPPYPSRVRLIPISATEAVTHDLVTGRTGIRLLFRTDGRAADLEVNGNKTRLRL